ncbi:MAG TPA: single-stranded-DNA-specific exonuclease RecJ [Candidatus Paceibacterota bacterium]
MEVSDLLRSLLTKRGIESDEHIAAFLNPSFDEHLQDPMLLSDMEKALERFFSALERQERIALYTDYDCDGIAGAVVLSDFLKKIRYENFEVYLPHRDIEGYGFHASAVKELAARGAKLIITADVGINGVAATRAASDAGVDVIITDHHEAMGEIPKAVAVVNPKLNRYPFPHLCGAAVAFKFVQAALAEGKRRKRQEFLAIPEGWEKWLLDVVALATIADMVSMTGENRVLVHWGLQVLRKSPRPGIIALCASARISQRAITEDDIGFSLAPRLNAASRMDHPDLAFQLLTTRSRAEAESLAHQLEQLNNQRKGVVASIVKQAKKRARERFGIGTPVTVLGDTAWKPALLGLAANSVMGERGGVVCLWGRDASGALKGSCRSDGKVSLVDLFANAPDVFEQYGGHANAGGFTVASQRVHTLHEDLYLAASNAARKIPNVDGSKAAFDAALPLSEISSRLLADISRLSPFGVGNTKPVFLVAGTTIGRVKRFGREQNHVEVILECQTSGTSIRAFEFFKGPEQFTHPPVSGGAVNVLATLQQDAFRGGLALRIVDVLPR